MPSQGSDQEYDECQSPPASLAALSSPGDTVDDSPFPTTPSSLINTSSARSPTRRRGKTISTIPDVSLINQALFTLSLDAPGNQQVSLSDDVLIMDEHNDQPLHAYDKDPKGPKHEKNAKKYESIIENLGESLASQTSVLDCSPQDSGPKDLAKHGVPSACVFVANLAASQTDDQLMKSLQAHFGKFGRLYVKIRRDLKGNPYSFCQFENDGAARLAVREGRNAIIDSTDRRIRCEPAKVNRTLILSRHDNASFAETDTQKILFGFGETESSEFATEMYSLPVRGLKDGKRCFIRFVYRQDAVDCYQYFRFHGTWTAEWTNNFASPSVIPRIPSREIDPLSLFVGRLNPDRIMEHDLRERFAKYGTIVECNLLNRASKNGMGRNAFAFIKYDSEEQATKAMENENNSQFLGTLIQVQKREIHKKPLRGVALGNNRLGTSKLPDPALLEALGQNFTAPSFCFSLKDVASLAAHLSLQFTNKPDQRRQSIASMVSNVTAHDSVNYGLPPDPLTARHGSYQSVSSSTPGFVFHQPFQTPYAMSNSVQGAPLTSDAPLSPRTAQATAVPTEQHGEGSFSADTNLPASYGASHHQYHNQGYFAVNAPHQGSLGDPYCGAFPPTHQQPQFSTSNHLVPQLNSLMGHSQRRDSTLSVPYEQSAMYGIHGPGFT